MKPSSLFATLLLICCCSTSLQAQLPAPVELSSGWEMQSAHKVPQSGPEVSSRSFSTRNWYRATVPGTALTTLVDNKVYPEPLYGENDRSDRIPDSLCRTDWWYRVAFTVPESYAGKQVWLHFNGINYLAQIWIDGKKAGVVKGAFTRGVFDITSLVNPGSSSTMAVQISPQPNPGTPAEHTMGAGHGPIGGISRIDGPTFACTIGWDWLPGIRDRDSGIWQKVFLSATGPVLVCDPQVTADLPLPRTDSADVTVAATLRNTSDQPQAGVLKGGFGDVSFQKPVRLAPWSAQTVAFGPRDFAQLHVKNPRLWWPNGYGPQNLYTVRLSFDIAGQASDNADVSFGIRKIVYGVLGSDNLAISVNGVRIFCKGGDWGLDEALKRDSYARLDAQIRMHRMANLNMIRNWGGQSTSDEFYDLCDRYGILVWDEFFQFNDADPLDVDLYLANCRDKIVRVRNHPSIAVWCGRNEGTPPKYLDDALRYLLTDLDPQRWYQSNSGGGRGVNSGGPYEWRSPEEYDEFDTQPSFRKTETFKTEIGATSVPTLESIQAMMPQSDWNVIDDDWAEHDFSAGGAHAYLRLMESRYGAVANVADFARKGQMMNYEGYRAMYEGREGKMFKPVEGILTWMSNPAQPSFIWQLYAYDLEPDAALFAVEKACEPVHIQFNTVAGGVIQVINHQDRPFAGRAHLAFYNLDGSPAGRQNFDVNAAACGETDLGQVAWPADLSPVHFIELELQDNKGAPISDNFYWHAAAGKPDDLASLSTLPVVKLDAALSRSDLDGRMRIDVKLRNPSPHVALMAHLQLHRATTKDRVLPVYYSDNYISLAPGESRNVTIEASAADLNGQKPLVLVDGWNIAIENRTTADASIAVNDNAQVANWPQTGLSFAVPAALPQDEVHLSCGGYARDGFQGDPGYVDGSPGFTTQPIDAAVPNAAPAAIYQTVRWGACSYPFQLKPKPGQTYTVRLHFAEIVENAPGRRVFNVSINGKIVLSNLDIAAEAGARDKALVKQFTGIAPDAGGRITIGVEKGKAGTPQMNGIEIMKE